MTAGTAGVLGVALAALLAFLPQLGAVHVHASGEARLGLVAREMRRTGQWIVPRLGARADTATPPLSPWAVALASPGGVSERSLRLPSALAAAAAAGVTGLTGARLLGPLAGVVAAAVLASSAAVFASARTGGPAMLATLIAALALWSLVRWLQEGRRLDAAALGLWTGLAAMTQVPVALIPLLVALGAAIVLRRTPARTARHLGLAAGVALALVVAWLGAVALLAPDAPDYLRALERRVTRDLGRVRPRAWDDVLAAFGGGFLPWSMLVPGAVLMAVWTWRNAPVRPGTGEAAARIGSWLPPLWAAVVVVLFAFGVHNRGVGPLVAFPGLALLVAWAWHSASPRGRWALALPLGALAFTVVLGGTWLRWQRLRFPIGGDPPIVIRPTLTAVTVTVCAAVASGAAVLLLRARRPGSSALALATGTLTILLVVDTAIRVETVNEAAPTPLLAGRFARQVPPRARLAHLDRGLTTAIAFYMPHESVRLSDAGSLRRFAARRRGHVLLVERDLADAAGRLGLTVQRLDSVAAGGFVYVLATVEGGRDARDGR